MIKLIELEYKTLIKGFLLAMLIVFPFTFLPVLFKEGEFLNRLLQRAPWSLLYSAIFSIFLVLAALAHNWSNLNDRLRYFSKPAFLKLGFEYEMKGKGSLVEDLSPRLYGIYNEMHFNIDIHVDVEDESRNKIIITPLIHYSNNLNRSFAYQRLNREFDVRDESNSIIVLLPLEEQKLNDPSYLSKNLTLISAFLKRDIEV